jgi:very-short-patch-repair endonuclease
MVVPQVPLNSILSVKSKRSKPKWEFWRHENKINKKVIDFVIFDEKYCRPLMAIEYDGKTHERRNRQERDRFVDNVLNENGIECKHLKHNNIESTQATREAIVECLHYDKLLQNTPSILRAQEMITNKF